VFTARRIQLSQITGPPETFRLPVEVARTTGEAGHQGRYWIYFAVVTLVVILIAAIRWSLGHPFGIHWDEAQYLNEIQLDVQRLRAGLLLRLAGRLLIKSGGRPPAYRLLALPFLAIFGFHTVAARLVSLACYCMSARFIYLAARRVGGGVAGAFAVLIFALSPEIVSTSIFFGTEGPLFLATSAMLYYLFESWSDTSKESKHWIGLGLAIGLGLLSKVSFLAIALPVLAFWFVISRYPKAGVPTLASQWKAGAIALVLAGPWWLFNIKSAFGYSEYARNFVRNSLGPPSITTWSIWLGTVVQGLVGPAVSILICLILIAALRKAVVRREVILEPFQNVALGACACAGLPIVLAQLSGTNHLLRHISPVLIPLAIAVGVLADRIGWTRAPASVAVSSALFCCQLAMLVAPVVVPNNQPAYLGMRNGSLPWRAMVRVDQWDWRPLRDIADRCGVEVPKISYLGGSRAFNPPQIQYPWVARIASTRLARFDVPDVKWLWRYEEGPIDWQEVMDSAGQSDFVITAPQYVAEGKNDEDTDNQYDAEFADRLSKDPRFHGPIRLTMGRFKPVDVVVFVKRSLDCHWDGTPQAH
jgi:hypothetical protein